MANLNTSSIRVIQNKKVAKQKRMEKWEKAIKIELSNDGFFLSILDKKLLYIKVLYMKS